MNKKYHLVPECQSSIDNIMGYEPDSIEGIYYTYLHGILESKACEHGGYDLYGFLGDVPAKETAILKGFVEYPDEKIDCTIFLWKDTTAQSRMHGLVVANDDEEHYQYAKKKFEEKALSI